MSTCSARAAALAALTLISAGLPCLTTAAAAAAPPAADRAGTSVAWRGDDLRVDTAKVVARSDLVLEQPAWRDEQSMPLGNGRLGAAVWNRDGFTAQLNRNDTFPSLRTAGRLVVPGLMRLATAGDYRGRVDLYDAELEQRGRGMSATAFVRADTDQLVLDVTGAPAGVRQTAELRLPANRKPSTYAAGDVAALAETFTARNGTTGAVAAMTAQARNVTATVVDDQTVRLEFTPAPDGSFRLVVGAPSYTGGDLATATTNAVAGASGAAPERHHLTWWHRFWDREVAPLRIESPDGVGEYMEALRAQQLYTTAATQRNELPTGQAGAANMLYPWPDSAVSPSTWFHFNVRQQVFANLGAGTAAFNAPYLRLFTTHLEQLRQVTREHWAGAEGVCVPELIDYDGTTPDGCDSDAGPTWTNRILSGGLEVAHNAWQTYRYTGDDTYLSEGYPLMREVALFYLSILEPGDDGRLHLHHVNSFETQWDTTDPMPDVAGMKVMFPIIARLAEQRGDSDLAERLDAAVPQLPDLPTTTRRGNDVYGWSATNEPAKNTQNTDLEAVYPWGLAEASSPLAQRTFRDRVFPLTREWNEDPIWAARLHLPDQMKELLVQGTEDLQKYANGFTVHGKNDDPQASHNLYSSWNGIVAGALQEGLVQSYDGTVRVAASVPEDWDVDGTVVLPGGHRASTQVRSGSPLYLGIEAGSDETLTVANPWPGEAVRVVSDDTTVVAPSRVDTVDVPVVAGRSYLLERVAHPVTSYRFAAVTGAAAGAAKHLGERTLGVDDGIPQIESDLVTDVAPEKLHALVRARSGNPLYVDRSDTIATLPQQLAGAVQVQGAQADARATTPADYLSFDLARPATVYAAFDARGEGTWWPGWLAQQGFERTPLTVGTRNYLRRFDIQQGHLRASGGGVTLSKQGVDWGDQVVDVTLRQIQVGASLVFRAPDSRNGYVWQIGGSLGSDGGLGQLRMSKMVDGRTTLLGRVVPIEPAPGNTYHLRIEAVGDRIRTFLDGKLVDERTDGTFAAGRVGFNLGGSDVGEYDDLSVSTPAGATLFEEDFSGDLSAWDLPPRREDVPLVVFAKQVPAGRVTLGPNSGTGQGDASYVTFVKE
ncbi:MULTISPECIES: glycosyl hydrolase family 95 catalytic domain-containing protein [unclassified Nocardioides]|uniref:glycosyl hydrolase family 95 catalytic domain-containing protein n=1 Tax=unclassified Nocardioides TaxID=2615069 RepID=UPI00360B8EBD